MEENTQQEQGNDLPLKIDAVTLYNATEEYLTELETDYTGLTVAGLDDKDGLKAVKDGKAKCRTLRNDVEKKRKGLKKKVDEIAATVQARILPVESHLDTEISKIEALQAAKDAEEAKAAEALFKERTELLFKHGAAFNGIAYYLGKVSITADNVRAYYDEAFAEVVASFEIEANELKEAEQKRKEAEADIEKQKAEIERQKKILTEKMAALGFDIDGNPLPVVPPATEEPVVNEPVSPITGTTEVPTVQQITESKAAEVAKNTGATGTMRTSFGSASPSFKKPDPVSEITEYEKGFNSAKAMVLLMLNDRTQQLTRDGLIDRITNLKFVP